MKKLLIIAIGATVSSTGWSITLFDNLIPGSSFSPVSDQMFKFPGFERQHGFRFTATATGTVTDVQARINGTPSQVAFEFFTNTSSDTIGSFLGSTTGSGPSLSGSQIGTFQAQSGPFVLNAGQSYWVKARMTVDGSANWYAGSSATQLPTILRFFSPNAEDFYAMGTAGGIKINAEPVPEPASMLALASGIALLVRRKRS